MKAPGKKTQPHVSEFASQVANQYYSMLVTMNALWSINVYDNSIRSRGTDEGMQEGNFATNKDGNIEVKFELRGTYAIRITAGVMDKARQGEVIYPKWKTNMNGVKNNNYKYRLHPRLVDAIIHRVKNTVDVTNPNDFYEVEGYTRLTTILQDGNQVIFHANSHFQGRMWYDWAYVHFNERMSNGETIERYYPAKVLGFVKIEDMIEAVIQCTDKPLCWSRLKKNFIEKVNLGRDGTISIVMVPLSSLVHPLCVVPDYGGNGTSYMVILPRRNWSKYFGDRIGFD